MLSRRKLLQVIGTGGIASAASRFFPVERARAATKPPLILSVRIAGGWDPTMVFDPKIGIGTVAQEAGALLTKTSDQFAFVAHANRPSVSAFFASESSRCAIINGIDTQGIEHDQAFAGNFSVQLSPSQNRGSDRRSDPSLTYAIQTNPGLLAPYVNIGTKSTAGAFSGYSHQLDSASIARYSTGNFHQSSTYSAATDDVVLGYVNSQFAQMLGAFPSVGLDTEKIDGLARNYSRERYFYELMPDVISSIGTPPTSLLRNMKIALKLMEAGQTLSVAVGDDNFHGWDSHRNNFAMQAPRFDSLFSDLSAALDYASDLGVADRLVLVVASDVGRAPFLNSKAGKDHWQFSSALVHSPLIRGGRVIGQTDDFLRGKPVNLDSGLGDATNGQYLTLAQVYAAVYVLNDQSVDGVFKDTATLNVLIKELET